MLSEEELRQARATGGLGATVTIALASVDATLRITDVPEHIRIRLQETRDILKTGQDRYDSH